MINEILDHLKQENIHCGGCLNHRKATPCISSFSFFFMVYQFVQTPIKYKDMSGHVIFCKNVPEHASMKNTEKSLSVFKTPELSF